jgi:hypothetical protein
VFPSGFPVRRPSFLALRKIWYSPELDDPAVNPNYADDNRYEVSSYEEANLVSSSLSDRLSFKSDHMPVLDIDFEAHLEPSSTPGHYHLYLNRRLTWENYQKLLDVMQEIGLLEQGFVKLSKERGATFARKPGHKKVR